MVKDLDPQLSYYIAIFALTILLRFIRAYRARPTNNPTAEEKRAYRSNYYYFGLEIVNVSAGVFILLSQKSVNYIGTILFVYMILMIFSFFLEDDKVGQTLKTSGHIIVSAIVIIMTILTFTTFNATNYSREKSNSDQVISHASNKYRVSLAYIDASVNRFLGVKSSPLESTYITTVEAQNRDGALTSATLEFYSAKGPNPYLGKVDKNKLNMILVENDSLVELASPSDPTK